MLLRLAKHFRRSNKHPGIGTAWQLSTVDDMHGFMRVVKDSLCFNSDEFSATQLAYPILSCVAQSG